VARPRKFTEAQWAEAMRLYVTEGPRAAGALTGIDPSAITRTKAAWHDVPAVGYRWRAAGWSD
jgi:hypothetical protein